MNKKLNELDEPIVIRSIEDIDKMKPEDVLDRYYNGTPEERVIIDQMRENNRKETERIQKELNRLHEEFEKNGGFEK